VAVTSFHNVYVFAVIEILLIIVSGIKLFYFIKRIVFGLFLVNLTVSLGFLIMHPGNSSEVFRMLILFNTRTVLLLHAALLAADRINLIRAFSFSPLLRSVLYIIISQHYVYRKLFQEFSDGYLSRSKPASGFVQNYAAKWKFMSSTLAFFLEKTLDQSEEITLAMKSRGFFK
jgi:cobalt/nickel transport system permease protein